ncbi:type IV pilin N-terminal domain-containing protein [Halovivax cerinus]|uniref:Type IV pilin N-terminal domain-containing protein n=1 Tax=Halovivax cerinus TaxID=1487865 RepID=A0ABD5NSN2_9EURY|nr:type IV pilin N-terminal domain-containing protein [Halovivax cerinus]
MTDEIHAGAGYGTLEASRALSPIVGAVTLLAITVILASVLAVLVGGFTGLVDPQVDAGVTVDQPSSTTVSVTYTAVGTSDHVVIRGDCAFGTTHLHAVGESTTQSCSPGDEVLVVAVHDDGTESLVTSYTVA